jgi:hypothetical protein
MTGRPVISEGFYERKLVLPDRIELSTSPSPNGKGES